MVEEHLFEFEATREEGEPLVQFKVVLKDDGLYVIASDGIEAHSNIGANMFLAITCIVNLAQSMRNSDGEPPVLPRESKEK